MSIYQRKPVEEKVKNNKDAEAAAKKQFKAEQKRIAEENKALQKELNDKKAHNDQLKAKMTLKEQIATEDEITKELEASQAAKEEAELQALRDKADAADKADKEITDAKAEQDAIDTKAAANAQAVIDAVLAKEAADAKELANTQAAKEAAEALVAQEAAEPKFKVLSPEESINLYNGYNIPKENDIELIRLMKILCVALSPQVLERYALNNLDFSVDFVCPDSKIKMTPLGYFISYYIKKYIVSEPNNLKTLIEHGADPNKAIAFNDKVTANPLTFLYFSLQETKKNLERDGHLYDSVLKEFKYLVEQNDGIKTDLNAVDPSMEATILYVAALYGNLDDIKYLISKGANISVIDISTAIKNNKYNAAKILLKEFKEGELVELEFNGPITEEQSIFLGSNNIKYAIVEKNQDVSLDIEIYHENSSQIIVSDLVETTIYGVSSVAGVLATDRAMPWVSNNFANHIDGLGDYDGEDAISVEAQILGKLSGGSAKIEGLKTTFTNVEDAIAEMQRLKGAPLVNMIYACKNTELGIETCEKFRDFIIDSLSVSKFSEVSLTGETNEIASFHP